MIQIDFVWAMAGFLGAGVIIVFTFWMFYSFNEGLRVSDGGENIEQCPYCTYLFFTDTDKDDVRCPCCKSFLTQLATAHRGET